LSILGYTVRQIASEVGLSHVAVWKIQRKIESQEIRRQADIMERRKIRQDAAIHRVVKEGFAAWFRSLEPRARAIARQSGNGDDLVSRESTEQNGNPQHLQIVLQALRDLRSLWGLDVMPAGQEPVTLASLAADLAERERAYEARKAEREARLAAKDLAPDPPPA
jgi:hypothetical protein